MPFNNTNTNNIPAWKRRTGSPVPPGADFVTVWKTDNAGNSASNQIKLPLTAGAEYDFLVDWGDGSTQHVTTFSSPTIINHTYDSPGTYTVTMNGIISVFSFGVGSQDPLKLLSILSWGSIKIANGSFNGCANLVLDSVSDVPDLTHTATLSGLFLSCSSITTINRLSEWDVSGITNFSSFFNGCSNFNQDLNTWNVSSATNMASMFLNASKFNQPLNLWDVSSVTNISAIFRNCSLFNQPLNSWNVSAVTNMAQTFSNCTVFNQPLNLWNVSSVTSFASIFSGAIIFNQALNIWNVASATNMSGMFQSAGAFNQPLNNWNTALVTNMSQMFRSANSFNQDISDWNISNVNNFVDFMQNKSFSNYSTANYDNILNKWSIQTLMPNNQINFGLIRYTSAGAAGRLILTSAPNNWTIIDGGII